jgi:hypothetical protein
MLVISHDQSSGTRQITKQLTVAVRVRLKPIDFRQVTVDPQLHHIDTRQADVDLLKQQWAQTFHAGQHIDSSHSRGQTANPYPRGNGFCGGDFWRSKERRTCIGGLTIEPRETTREIERIFKFPLKRGTIEIPTVAEGGIFDFIERCFHDLAAVTDTELAQAEINEYLKEEPVVGSQVALVDLV